MKARKDALRKSLTENEVLITKERESILSLDIDSLREQLKTGTLKPIHVLKAYQVYNRDSYWFLTSLTLAHLQAKALEVTSVHNCVCDFIDSAEDQALELENLPIEERGPLYGIPISVKECFFVKGHDTTLGITRCECKH